MNKRSSFKFKLLVILLSLVLIVPGCVSTQGEHRARNTGIATGAVTGFLVGLVSSGGDLKKALIGAAAGAVVGGLIGAYIDHKQTKSKNEVVQMYGNTPKVILKDIALSKEAIRPREKAFVTLDYVIIASQEPQNITETFIVYEGNEEIAKKTQGFSLNTGEYITKYPLVIPEGAQEGEYKIVASISDGIRSDTKTKSFTVIVAKNADGSYRLALSEARQ